MKIQCDVCNKEEASVFCTADEAALCNSCDHRVHHANKLASKHQRFSLLQPSSKQYPVCDICQEKRAFLFCQQDRAILCRDCDVRIHTANEHTQKHNRFLLTGIKLSSASAFDSSPSVVLTDPNTQEPCISKESVSVSSLISNPTTIAKNSTSSITENLSANEDDGSTSGISKYLIETLPDWHLENLLDSTSASLGFFKSDDMSFLDDSTGKNLGSFSSENMGIWVPQTPATLAYPSTEIGGVHIVFKETKEGTNLKANNKRWIDDGFTVPQVSPDSYVSKRVRSFWW